MPALSKTLHLIVRNGVYYYKRRVPAVAQEAFGGPMYQVSLETRILKEAEGKRALQDILFHARVDAVRANEQSKPVPVSASTAVLEAEVRARVRQFVAMHDTKANDEFVSYSAEEERNAAIQNIETELQCLAAIDDPFGHELIANAYPVATGLLQTHPKAADLVQRGLVEVRNRKIDRIHNGYSRPYFDPMFGPTLEHHATFKEVADQYLKFATDEAEANKRRPHTSKKKAALVATVVEMIGSDTRVDAISFDAVQHFRLKLDRLPANRNKLFPGKTIDQAIALATKSSKRLSYLAQCDYASQLRLILDLALKKQLITHNFAHDLRPLKVDTVSDGDRRPSFSTDQIQQLFSCDYYAKCSTLPVPYRGDTNGGWRFWLPLMMLFGGMRPNEVCQLRLSDFKTTKAGVHYINVTNEESDEDAAHLTEKSVKTRNSVRKVPVHPVLIKIGLLAYVQDRREAGDVQLFPTLMPKGYGNYATYPARRFNERFLLDAIELEQGQVLYSLRHSFRDTLRRIDAPNDTLRALGGWADRSETSSDYGDRTNPDFQAKWIERVSYPGVDLSPLYVKPKEASLGPHDDA